MDADVVVDAYRSGASMLKLARRYGVATQTIRRMLTEAGEPIRGPGKPRSPVHSDDVAELRDAGASWEEISTRLEISPRAASGRYDEIRSQRGLVRRGRWHKLLSDALEQSQPVPVLPTVAADLGRHPTANEAVAARRAAHDLARRGEAVASHELATWQGQRLPLLVLRRPYTKDDHDQPLFEQGERST